MLDDLMPTTGDYAGTSVVEFKNLDIEEELGAAAILAVPKGNPLIFVHIAAGTIFANQTMVDIKNADGLEKAKLIYEKYKDKLNFDYDKFSLRDGHFYFQAKDNYDKNGNEDKSEVLARMIEEFDKAGIIGSYAYYYPLDFCAAYGCVESDYLSFYDVPVAIEEFESTASAIVDKYDLEAEVFVGSDAFEKVDDCYNIQIIGVNGSVTKLFQIWDDILGVYPGIKGDIPTCIFEDEVSISSEPIDLLAAIGETDENGITYGDLNSDGRIGIGDAIAINKFVNGSIILNEEQTKAADLNSDGTVNGDDLYTMLRYLVDDIDTLPLAE